METRRQSTSRKNGFLAPYYDLEEDEADQSTPNAVAVEFAISTFWDGISATPNGDAFVSAGMITQICEYCLPKESDFLSWKDAAGARLVQYFSKKQTVDDRAPTIPKKFFEPEVHPGTMDWHSAEARLVGDPDEAMNRYLPLTPRED